MPPALSDEENSDSEFAASAPSTRKGTKRSVSYVEPDPEIGDDDDVEEVPGKQVATNGRTSKSREDEVGEDVDGDGVEEEEEEYVVEKIMSHRFVDGVLYFEVKWEGYEKKSDRTWEPEENLIENASAALDEYFESIGGRERVFEEKKASLKGKKRGRPAANSPAASSKRSRRNGHPRDSTPPESAERAAWKPPAGSWEDEIASLDACEDEETHKLMVYLTWKNGHRTQHETSVIYKRCPQKMLQFYERHVRIIKRDQDEPASAASPNP
ncbi:hypothetical protein VTK73DRAFT_8778 [Phialemonium thermophilum]|uniref:Chromo domain-containing protein n=1 Tax=Phialemonium thermophilum TaxID=223376 RepID=A0ABR3XNI6_9PEZI